MKLLIGVFILVLLFGEIRGQNYFVKSLDIDSQSDGGQAIKVLDDGYLILGNSYCFSGSQECYSMIKTDFSGNIVWKKQLMDASKTIRLMDYYGNHGVLKPSNSDFIYTCGNIVEAGSQDDCFVLKMNSDGDTLWLKKYGTSYGDFSSTILQRTDSTLLLFSDFAYDADNDVISLVEIDFDGNIVWQKTYGEPNKNVARQDIIQLENGNIVFTHFSCDRKEFCYFGDTITLNITKIAKNGEVLWSEALSRFTEYWTNSTLIALSNGGFAASFYRVNFEPGWWYPPVLLFADSIGKKYLEFEFPAGPESLIFDIELMNSGEIIGVGYVDKFDLGFAGWVFSMTQNGVLNWNREIVDLRFPDKVLALEAIEESESDGLIITGFIYDTLENQVPHVTNRNIALVKLDNQGCISPNCSDLQIVATDTEFIGQFDIGVFPNPAHNYIEILTEENIIPTSIRIFSIDGRIVKNFVLAGNSNKLDIDFEPGIYIYSIYKDNNVLQLGKLIVR